MFLSITVIIIIVNVLVSFAGFQREEVFDRLSFRPAMVWYDKQWYRMLTSGFLHVDYTHLIFNMMSLYSFGIFTQYAFEHYFGEGGMWIFAGFYLAAIVFSSIPDLIQQKNNQYFHAVGASGGVSAVIFASILFSPMSDMGLLFIPLRIPAFVFGALYLLYSAYMAKRQSDNIGHLAHFSGAIFGFAFPLIFHPGLFMEFLTKIINRI